MSTKKMFRSHVMCNPNTLLNNKQTSDYQDDASPLQALLASYDLSFVVDEHYGPKQTKYKKSMKSRLDLAKENIR